SDIRDNPPEAAEIRDYMAKVGWEKLLNRRSTTWRTLPDTDKSDISDEKAVQLIVEYPTLMKRPLIVSGRNTIVGFDKQAIAQLEALVK
ncbi:MAG: hypothetical protein K8F25_18140, partial [Fimbriimonadaceae bacterium]|nr:hypothetical protein [Alphaproteobacteria bacterium]